MQNFSKIILKGLAKKVYQNDYIKIDLLTAMRCEYAGFIWKLVVEIFYSWFKIEKVFSICEWPLMKYV